MRILLVILLYLIAPNIQAQGDVVCLPDTGTIYIGSLGQSNAEDKQPCQQTGDSISVSNCEVWNGSAWVNCSSNVLPFYQQNITLSFAKKLREERPTQAIKIVADFHGNTEIEKWLQYGSYQYFNTFVTKVANSGVSAEGIDIIIWHQGENNNDAMTGGICNTDLCYTQYLNELIDLFNAQTWFDGCFIAGQLLTGLPTNTADDRNPALWSLNDSYFDKNMTASSNHLTGCDFVHFDGKSIHEMGYVRYWNAMILRLLITKTKVIRTSFSVN